MATPIPTPPRRGGERTPAPRAQIGPVSRAIAIMRAADPDTTRIRELRKAIADRIEADIALLDVLSGDADFEPSLCGLSVGHPSAGGDDREDGDDHGIIDCDSAAEQGFREYGRYA